MNLLETAPRTKDGKHEIVFTPGLYDNHEFSLRSAFEGRRLWELVNVLRDKERGKALAEKYPQFLFEYDCVQDSEGLFGFISIPYIGRISRDRKSKKHRRFEAYEGDKLIPPFFPLYYAPEWVAEHIEEGTIKSADEKSLRYEDRSLIYLWTDSPNAVNCPHFESIERSFDGWQELYDEFPEMKQYGKKGKEITYQEYRERFGDLIHKLRVERPALDEIRKDENLMSGLENIARLHVLDSLAVASWYQRDSKLRERAPKKTSRNSSDREWANASPELTKRLADSAVALCEEYLSEMENRNLSKTDKEFLDYFKAMYDDDPRSPMSC